MACYNPITAYKTELGCVVFTELKRNGNITTQLKLACGQCIGCRLERSRQWAMRCVHEAQMHPQNSFITLTYDDNNLPYRNNLNYEDFQKFMKRLRKHTGPSQVRFYMGGEYGELNWRPHFHACIFGWDWPDKVFFKRSPSGERVYTSATLQRLWPFGYSSTANVTFQSAAYIARYCVQKVTGKAAEEHYKRQDENGVYHLTPEFNQMSRKPGLGATWFAKYKTDVYNHDHVIVNGMECSPPKYYDKILKRENRDRLEQLKETREQDGLLHKADNTHQRLDARHQVAKAKAKMLLRNKV